MQKTLIHNIYFAGDDIPGWILVTDDKIAGIGRGDTLPAIEAERIDGHGALALPGVIDCHVHMREPGLTHKADIAGESRAAIAGGVTSYLDMPNCKPATTTIEAWQWKMDRAAAVSAANYGFFIGATNDNIDTLRTADYTRIPGVKLFMGSSTGNMLVDDDDTISRIFAQVDAIVAVHAEDQDIIDANTQCARQQYESGQVPMALHSQIRSARACLESTSRAVQLARRHNRRLHICHITTAAELALLSPGNPADKLITAEVSPHHLMWTQDDYDTRGARIKMNPAVKTAADRQALRQALTDGLIDMVATDHAPHLLSEKQGDALTAVSGAPLVQFSLPVMLGMFDPLTVQRTMCLNPALVYRIDRRGSLDVGNYADIVLVEECKPYTISDEDVISKCGWTPLDGVTLRHRVSRVWVNGVEAWDGKQVIDHGAARALTFGTPQHGIKR